MSKTPPPIINNRRSDALLWLLLVTLLMASADYLWLGARFVFVPAAAIETADRWRAWDSLPGWIAVLILAFADQFFPGRSRKVVPWILAAGLAALFAGILLPEGSPRTATSLVALSLLALAAVVVGLRQLSNIAQTGANQPAVRGGFTVEQLWRLLAVQWMLVWIAAEIFLRLKFRQQGLLDDPARNLLFAIPAFGLVPNVLMAVGVRWWGTLQAAASQHSENAGGTTRVPSPTQVRVRAWIVALVALNLGSLGVVSGGIGPRWLAMIATVPLIFGVGLYLLGFPRGAWSAGGSTGGGRLVFVAFGLFVLGVLLFAFDQAMSGSPPSSLLALMLAPMTWHWIIGIVTILLWLAGIGGKVMHAFVPPRLQPRLALRMSHSFLISGVCLTIIGLLLATSVNRSWLASVALGTALSFLGVAIGAAAALRASRSI